MRKFHLWVEHGEKNTKYFLNLEKQNYNKNVITKLKKSDGTEITDPNHILREEEKFYTNLYSPEISNFSKEELEEANIYFLSQQTSASLNPNEVQLCEGEISERERLENLKAMPNGKSPGTDGFPAEFYKVFWIDLKDILLSCYVAAFRTGKMSISQRRGIITLIPKSSVPFLLKKLASYLTVKYGL